MLEQANAYLTAYTAAQHDPAADPGTVDRARWRVTNMTENIAVVRGLDDLYGYLYF